MKLKTAKFHIGLRTIKTAIAVIISMIIVEFLGTSESKLIFAMLGAMAAVQPTFKESVESSLTQIIGVVFGAVLAVILQFMHLPPLVATGIGIVLVITLYNTLHLRFSPGLPCLIVVMLCIDPEEKPILYALERVWDTAIGLFVGMLLNMLIFPYDNSRRIRIAAESLDKDLIEFLEDMFDGDDILPNVSLMSAKISEIDKQLNIFAKQKLFWRLRRQKEELHAFQNFENKAKTLVAQLECLSMMPQPGRLNQANKLLLEECGAQIRDTRTIDTATETDIVTNYHICQILSLRSELMEILRNK